MNACRQLTLELFTDINSEIFCRQAHSDYSPIGWHLGHIAFTESRWILEHLAGESPVFPQYRQLFAADGLPKEKRQELPTFTIIQDYLETVRTKVFAYLQTAPLEAQARLWWWLLQHETQHSETIAFVLALHRLQSGQHISVPTTDETPITPTMVNIPSGYFVCGSNEIWAQDNERSPHEVYLDEYAIDAYPVTCGQFTQFISAGGYSKQQWWSDAGWQWRSQHNIIHPLYWNRDAQNTNHPVCGVSYYEAEAYANFIGKRLPSEWEWEKAAAWHPELRQNQTYPWGSTWQPNYCNHNLRHSGTTSVQTYAQTNRSAYHCHDLLGNVWEWTSSIFAPYPQFQSYPYPGYSQSYFDGVHYVLRGGSWVTRPWGLRNTFRNWYHPWTREIFAGFRCAA